jgi:hypothetical protein
MQVQQSESSSMDEATAGGLMTTSVSARPSSMSGFSHGLYGPASFCSLPLCGSLEDADNCPLTLHEESADTDSCFPSCSPTSSIAFAHSRPRSDPSTDSQYVHTYMDTHSLYPLQIFPQPVYHHQRTTRVHQSACMHEFVLIMCVQITTVLITTNHAKNLLMEEEFGMCSCFEFGTIHIPLKSRYSDKSLEDLMTAFDKFSLELFAHTCTTVPSIRFHALFSSFHVLLFYLIKKSLQSISVKLVATSLFFKNSLA